MIEGELRFKLGGDVHRAPAGSFVFVPRGEPHCFQNVADAPARIQVMFTPAGMERFFDWFAELSMADPEAFRSIGAPLGMEVIGPSLGQSDPKYPSPRLSAMQVGGGDDRRPCWAGKQVLAGRRVSRRRGRSVWVRYGVRR